VSAGAASAGRPAGLCPEPDPEPADGATPGGVATAVLVDELSALVGGARHEARFIVDEVLGAGVDGVGGVGGVGGVRPDVVPGAAATAARAMAARRAAGEPLQYIFGHWPFRGLDLRVDPRVLIPRPETEQVVEVALREARRLHGGGRTGTGAGLVLVDAGTGSGAIALALATELGVPMVQEVWATDTSAAALEVAARNRERCGARGDGAAANAVPSVELAEGTWLAPLPERLRGRVDLVVSNPPYVSEGEWAGLAPEVRAEPRQALVAADGASGTPGAADVEAVLGESRRWLARPGAVVVELAPPQAAPAQGWALQLGYDEVRVEKDLAGRPRALVARLSGSQ
jgi:release factor glutamine methyltransferase